MTVYEIYRPGQTAHPPSAKRIFCAMSQAQALGMRRVVVFLMILTAGMIFVPCSRAGIGFNRPDALKMSDIVFDEGKYQTYLREHHISMRSPRSLTALLPWQVQVLLKVRPPVNDGEETLKGGIEHAANGARHWHWSGSSWKQLHPSLKRTLQSFSKLSHRMSEWTLEHRESIQGSLKTCIMLYIGYAALRRLVNWYSGLTEYEVIIDAADHAYLTFGSNLKGSGISAMAALRASSSPLIRSAISEGGAYESLYQRMVIALERPCLPQLMKEYAVRNGKSVATFLEEVEVKVRAYRHKFARREVLRARDILRQQEQARKDAGFSLLKGMGRGMFSQTSPGGAKDSTSEIGGARDGDHQQKVDPPLADQIELAELQILAGMQRGVAVLQARQADAYLRLMRQHVLGSANTCEDLLTMWRDRVSRRAVTLQKPLTGLLISRVSFLHKLGSGIRVHSQQGLRRAGSVLRFTQLQSFSGGARSRTPSRSSPSSGSTSSSSSTAVGEHQLEDKTWSSYFSWLWSWGVPSTCGSFDMPRNSTSAVSSSDPAAPAAASASSAASLGSVLGSESERGSRYRDPLQRDGERAREGEWGAEFAGKEEEQSKPSFSRRLRKQRKNDKTDGNSGVPREDLDEVLKGLNAREKVYLLENMLRSLYESAGRIQQHLDSLEAIGQRLKDSTDRALAQLDDSNFAYFDQSFDQREGLRADSPAGDRHASRVSNFDSAGADQGAGQTILQREEGETQEGAQQEMRTGGNKGTDSSDEEVGGVDQSAWHALDEWTLGASLLCSQAISLISMHSQAGFHAHSLLSASDMDSYALNQGSSRSPLSAKSFPSQAMPSSSSQALFDEGIVAAAGKRGEHRSSRMKENKGKRREHAPGVMNGANTTDVVDNEHRGSERSKKQEAPAARKGLLSAVGQFFSRGADSSSGNVTTAKCVSNADPSSSPTPVPSAAPATASIPPTAAAPRSTPRLLASESRARTYSADPAAGTPPPPTFSPSRSIEEAELDAEPNGASPHSVDGATLPSSLPAPPPNPYPYPARAVPPTQPALQGGGGDFEPYSGQQNSDGGLYASGPHPDDPTHDATAEELAFHASRRRAQWETDERAALDALQRAYVTHRNQWRTSSVVLRDVDRAPGVFVDHLEAIGLKRKSRRGLLGLLLRPRLVLRLGFWTGIVRAGFEGAKRSTDIAWGLEQVRRNVHDFIVRRITTPTVSILNDVLLNKKATLSDRAALTDAKRSLGVMINDFLAQHGKDSRGARIPEAERRRIVRDLDMQPLSEVYERELKKPLQNILSGRIARLVLIQLQFVKKELLVAMEALDELFSANQVNLQLLAVTPAIMSLLALQVVGRTLLAILKSSSRGRVVESRAAIHRDLRNGVREIERLLVYSPSCNGFGAPQFAPVLFGSSRLGPPSLAPNQLHPSYAPYVHSALAADQPWADRRTDPVGAAAAAAAAATTDHTDAEADSDDSLSGSRRERVRGTASAGSATALGSAGLGSAGWGAGGSLDSKELGRLLSLLHRLHLLLVINSTSFDSDLLRKLQEDLRDLTLASLSTSQRVLIVQRIHRAYPFIMAQPARDRSWAAANLL